MLRHISMFVLLNSLVPPIESEYLGVVAELAEVDPSLPTPFCSY